MSIIPPLPTQARFYSPQGPPHPQQSAQSNLATHTSKQLTLYPLKQHHPTKHLASAVIYCEGHFGGIDGKTANGLVRHSEKYEILSVIDSQKAGQDAGVVLDGKANSIPIHKDLATALSHTAAVPAFFIYGIAPSSGMLSSNERALLLNAMSLGMNIVNGLHEFLNDDAQFAAACITHNVNILDIRRPKAKKELHIFSGRITEVTCPRIAILGTDCAIGKRTTATILARALRHVGLNVVLIGTGQTSLIQGARYGIALDAVPSQFCAGELEAIILEAFQTEKPDVILIEGQGALSHPAYSTTSFILRGSCPNGVILQHAPKRKARCDFDLMPMPSPESEINLIQTFSDTTVIGLTLNHENMTNEETCTAAATYERKLGIPSIDALSCSPKHLVDMVFKAFPELSEKQTICPL